MSTEDNPSDFVVFPDDVVILKQGFIELADAMSYSPNPIVGGRFWGPLVRRAVADNLIDTNQIDHPLWHVYNNAGEMPARSPLQFLWTPAPETLWQVNDIDGLVVRSLQAYTQRISEITQDPDHEDAFTRKDMLRRYVGDPIGKRTLEFWKYVCERLL